MSICTTFEESLYNFKSPKQGRFHQGGPSQLVSSIPCRIMFEENFDYVHLSFESGEVQRRTLGLVLLIHVRLVVQEERYSIGMTIECR